MTSFGNVIGRHKKMAKLAYNFVRTITAKNDDKKVMGSTFNDFFEIILAVYCSEVPQLYFFYISKIFNKTISLKMQIFKIDYKQSTTSSKDRTVLICSLTEKKVHHHRHNLDLPRSMFKVYISLLSEATLTHNLSHSH